MHTHQFCAIRTFDSQKTCNNKRKSPFVASVLLVPLGGFFSGRVSKRHSPFAELSCSLQSVEGIEMSGCSCGVGILRNLALMTFKRRFEKNVPVHFYKHVPEACWFMLCLSVWILRYREVYYYRRSNTCFSENLSQGNITNGHRDCNQNAVEEPEERNIKHPLSINRRPLLAITLINIIKARAKRGPSFFQCSVG